MLALSYPIDTCFAVPHDRAPLFDPPDPVPGDLAVRFKVDDWDLSHAREALFIFDGVFMCVETFIPDNLVDNLSTGAKLGVRFLAHDQILYHLWWGAWRVI